MEAYAKLIGRIGLSEKENDSANREFFVTILPCTLGRAINEEVGIVIDPIDTLLSRQHAQITWSQEGGWKLICLSKNGCTVDKKKYSKDAIISLHHGSAIRIGNARLYFNLSYVPEEFTRPLSVQQSNNKRPYIETISATDEEEADLLIMTMPNVDDKPTRKRNKNNGNSAAKLPQQKDTYLTMILSAMDCGKLTSDENKSYNQNEIMDWIGDSYYDVLGDLQKKTLRSGLYKALSKHLERVIDHDYIKRPKKGTIRWRKFENINYENNR